MVSDEGEHELAGDLATGDVTVSQAYVVQGDQLSGHLDNLPPDSPLRNAFTYWHHLRSEGGLPSRQDINPTDLDAETLPHIVIIDVEDDRKRRFRYRLVGTAVVKIFGVDYTGNYLDEMGLDLVFDRIQAFYSLVCNDPQPALLTGSYFAKSGAEFQVTRLAMPLFNGDGLVNALFCIVEST